VSGKVSSRGRKGAEGEGVGGGFEIGTLHFVFATAVLLRLCWL